MIKQTMSDITDAHRRAAFLTMRWTGWTFEAAMLYDLRRRLVEARATEILAEEWIKTQQRSVASVKHMTLGCDGHPLRSHAERAYSHSSAAKFFSQA